MPPLINISPFLPLAKAAAVFAQLDPALVCAVVEQESNWNTFAIRYEPQFMAKYVAPMYVNNKVSATEAYARSFSWGLMQVMGQTAREIGFDGLFLSALCDPDAGLKFGCKVLAVKMHRMNGDLTKTLLAWNGGSNLDYPKQVIGRMAQYR